MNNITKFKFIKVPIKSEIIKDETGEVVKIIEFVIKLKNLQNGKARIHRFTDFLTQYRNQSPKYVNDLADRIVIFLNYIYFEINDRALPNIQELNFEIGASFLEGYSMSKSKATIKLMESTLTRFYFFLAKKEILERIHPSDFQIKTNKHNKEILSSPFDGMYKDHSEEKDKTLHEIDHQLILPFLETVLEHSPQIAFGVYIQLFGGLRVSEVVSLEYHNMSFRGPKGKDGIILNIKKKDLRPDLTYGHIRQAKKPGKQTIINIQDLLPKLYAHHKTIYKNNITNAIFVNKNGLPMTDSVYRKHYNKARDKFMERLINSNNPLLKSQGLFLKSKRWSTHFNRGIYSNMVADVSDSVIELAVARRDSSFDSALTYITDSKKIEKKLQTLMNDYYSRKLNNL